ncbi:tetratricopeptide repeat protein [Paenisporosarcina cavernae]|uniref:Tetratricopeptide repeat protein n=1 Tax=Paenisporosarcina cavernae TaxID=2320858 RepID=A0A385YT77_9BACL|nr:tetratricopeptide repeat protein [Paenisporosarcina cavernae]AYC29711.1 tetratricopeptide repeat protein [Paenisporosarcina cavernae]
MTEMELGIQAVQEKDYEKAAIHFNQAIEDAPNDPIGYINFGNLLARMNEIERAERFFQKAITLDESAATAYYGLANLYFESERLEEAAKLYEKAIRYELKSADAYYMLARSLDNLGSTKLALPYYQRAAELEKKDIQIQLSFGICLATLEMFEEAKEQFFVVLALDENNADAHYNLGVLYAVSTEDIESAKHHLHQAVTLQPNFDQARYVYDMLSMKQ